MYLMMMIEFEHLLEMYISRVKKQNANRKGLELMHNGTLPATIDTIFVWSHVTLSVYHCAKPSKQRVVCMEKHGCFRVLLPYGGKQPCFPLHVSLAWFVYIVWAR